MRRVARARRLIKRPALVLLGAIALLGLGAQTASAQAPDEDWRTLTTEHFRVTFPARMEVLGRRAANAAEVAYVELSEAFIEPRTGRIDMVVTDHTDESNGYAQVVPSRRITVFARPALDQPHLSYFDNWVELVVTHELAHVFHLDQVRNPLGRLLRTVFGRAESDWPYFPNLSTPLWVIEGLATWYESDLTNSGRVHGAYHDMVLRTAMLEGRFESLDQASGLSPLWPGPGRSYAYGSLFFEYLLGRFGEDRMAAFADAVAGQWIPYRMNAAGRSAFGVSLSQAWIDWTRELDERTAAFDVELAALGPVTEPERLTTGARWALYPQVSPDGRTLVHDRADGRSDFQLYRHDLESGAQGTVGRTNSVSTFAWMPDGRLLLSQLEQAGPYRSYADLYVMDLDGRTERLTRGARLEHPSAAPDGSWAVAAQQGDGTSGLVRVDLASGALTPLVPPDVDVHWGFPRVSPNGRWIAATRWLPDAYQDVVILDAASGREVHRVSSDRALDLAPSWSPDSRWIVWSSDRTGTLNVLAAEVDPSTGRAGAPLLLTNVRTGANYPSVDPQGEWLYFSGYHADGWDAERVRFDPTNARVAPAPIARFAPAPPPAPGTSGARTQAPGTVQDYSMWPTLLPRYWQPRVREPVVAPADFVGGVPRPRRELTDYGFGAETTGYDLVRRHAYGLYAQAFTSGDRMEGGFSYLYQGFGNPVIGLSGDQLWGFAGTLLSGPAPDTVYALERERGVSGTLTLLSARARRAMTLTLGGGLFWERRELIGADLGPTPYVHPRPTSRLGELRVAIGYSTVRSHTFQTGGAAGFSTSLSARSRRHFGLADADVGIVGTDRTFADLTGRARAYVPLWGGGHATHVLALQLAGGSAFGPGAQFGHFGVGGATGRPEDLTGLELFGGSFEFLSVRGYPSFSRFGRFAWASSAEYRFPIALVHRGLGAWPLYIDRVVGSLFVDAGNAWDPNPAAGAIASAGAELTVGIVGFFSSGLLVRTGVAAPLVAGGDPVVYVRAGLPF